VFVGNLAWEVAWQDLKDHMRAAGHVLHADVLRNPDGRSKGCGIVEFSSPEEAQVAIETLNDSLLKNRPIFVREDREAGRPRREPGERDRDRVGSVSGAGAAEEDLSALG
jgi:RNA recognition motif-containing protein